MSGREEGRENEGGRGGRKGREGRRNEGKRGGGVVGRRGWREAEARCHPS